MPAGWFFGCFPDAPRRELPPRPGHGKSRGVTKTPRRPRRRNRRKP